MKSFIAFAALLALATAAPYEQGVSLTQDTLGNYNLKYSTHESSRDEQGFDSGKVIGSYSYTDEEGQHHKVTYIAAADHGFTVESADLPRPVHETAEVAAARAAHLAIVAHERSVLPPLKEDEHIIYVPTAVTPAFHFEKPTHIFVDNTAELEAAKAEHFAAHQEALEHLAAEYRRLAAF